MRILSERTTKSRKAHRCCACLRVFPSGTKIRHVKVVYDGISTWKECPTCAELLRKDPKSFDDGCGLFEYGCVDASLDVGQTPEILLSKLDKTE